jgi:hypothetical protein
MQISWLKAGKTSNMGSRLDEILHSRLGKLYDISRRVDVVKLFLIFIPIRCRIRIMVRDRKLA